jgi:hypothetical protein
MASTSHVIGTEFGPGPEKRLEAPHPFQFFRDESARLRTEARNTRQAPVRCIGTPSPADNGLEQKTRKDMGRAAAGRLGLRGRRQTRTDSDSDGVPDTEPRPGIQ